jgi:hypothetical protein
MYDTTLKIIIIMMNKSYGYDHLILKLEWAKPSAPKDAGSEPVQFRSGYGKALAQDTDQKVCVFV